MVTIYALSAFKPELKGLIRDIRVVWTLEELGEAYQRKVLDPKKREHKTPEYLALNPFGKVPTLQDGNFTLFESSAICSYLGDKHARLLPKPGSRERAVYDQWVAFTISTFEPSVGRILGFDFFNEKNEVTAKMRADTVKIVEGLMQTLDGIFAKQSYLLGSDFSIADILLCSVSRFIAHTELSKQYQHFDAYLERCYARPAYSKAAEMNGQA